MSNGILYNRLQYQWQDRIIRDTDLLIRIEIPVDPIAEAQLLDPQITADIVQFLLQRHISAVITFKNIMHGLRQEHDRRANFRILVSQRLHAYHFEGVVKVVRVQLALQHLELDLLLTVFQCLITDDLLVVLFLLLPDLLRRCLQIMKCLGQLILTGNFVDDFILSQCSLMHCLLQDLQTSAEQS